MAIDKACWRTLVADLERAHEVLSADLRGQLAAGVRQLTLFGEPPNINLDSPAQVMDALSQMGIKVEGTRNWQLQALGKDHPVVAKLLEYRSVQKLLSSYGPSLLDHIHPVSGRLHADFRQMGATGGRMSCSDPIFTSPQHTEYRKCFSAPQGRKLLSPTTHRSSCDTCGLVTRHSPGKSADVGRDLHCVHGQSMLESPSIRYPRSSARRRNNSTTE